MNAGSGDARAGAVLLCAHLLKAAAAALPAAPAAFVLQAVRCRQLQPVEAAAKWGVQRCDGGACAGAVRLCRRQCTICGRTGGDAEFCKAAPLVHAAAFEKRIQV